MGEIESSEDEALIKNKIISTRNASFPTLAPPHRLPVRRLRPTGAACGPVLLRRGATHALGVATDHVLRGADLAGRRDLDIHMAFGEPPSL